jgi:putative ABC transport system ATP-binding protein
VFLHGPSGSGKSTFLGLIAGVLKPQAGFIVHQERHDFGTMSEGARDAFRGCNLGYIFQMFNLLPFLSARQNITLPLDLHPERRRRAQRSAAELAAQLGLTKYLDQLPVRLSTGQQQRVAAARALIGAPGLIIADEPTSSLDFDQRERFLELLFQEARAASAAVLFVSHDRTLAPLFDRAVSLAELNQP